jgi:hypothetical protein
VQAELAVNILRFASDSASLNRFFEYFLYPQSRHVNYLPCGANYVNQARSQNMKCSNCAYMLERDSLEHRWHDGQMIARSSYSCAYCNQVWIKDGKDLIRAIPLGCL